jgi:hypothetical protein
LGQFGSEGKQSLNKAFGARFQMFFLPYVIFLNLILTKKVNFFVLSILSYSPLKKNKTTQNKWCILLGFCLRPVSEAGANGLGTTIFPTHPPTHPPLLLIFSFKWLPMSHKMTNDTWHYLLSTF